MNTTRGFSIISFFNGLIVAAGIVLAILMYLAFMPFIRYAREWSPINEGQVWIVFYLGIIASTLAFAYEVYRWTRSHYAREKA